jgi:transmembrane protein
VIPNSGNSPERRPAVRHFAAGGVDLACRALLSVLFLATGIAAAMAPFGFAHGLGQMGVPLPAVAAAISIAINLVAPLVLVFDVRGLGWLAACVLALFTAITIPFGHAWWMFDEPRRGEEFRIATEHISLIGGLLLAGLASFRGRARG